MGLLFWFVFFVFRWLQSINLKAFSGTWKKMTRPLYLHLTGMLESACIGHSSLQSSRTVTSVVPNTSVIASKPSKHGKGRWVRWTWSGATSWHTLFFGRAGASTKTWRTKNYNFLHGLAFYVFLFFLYFCSTSYIRCPADHHSNASAGFFFLNVGEASPPPSPWEAVSIFAAN